ncbi:MAG TPA: dipeptide/oligopeptide/nickel ABC transporter permease/ATP-binding protein [Mycobacteriales bacterium]
MTILPAEAVAEPIVTPAPLAAPDPAPSPGRAWRRRPLGTVAGAYLVLLTVACAGASWWAPADPEFQDLAHPLAGPSGAHWLGTDRLGRDVLSRLLFGGQVSIVSVLEAVAVFAVLGITLGVVAGYAGGWVDRAIGWLADLLLALPGIIVLLMVLSVFPGNGAATMVVLGVISSPLLLRVTRGVTRAVRGEPYVQAARLSGLTPVQVMRRHVLPRLTGPIIVQVSLFAATAVLVQAALSFLGLSVPETEGPSWGNMVAAAAQVTSDAPWLAVPTGGILILTVLALGLLGDALRDARADRFQPAFTVRRAPKRAPAPAESASLLAVRNLTVGFGGQAIAVRDVSFDVAAGEIVGIVGESGSGKTVTARSLLGLLPPTGQVLSGSAVFEGTDLTALSEAELGRVRGSRIALVSQEPLSGLDPVFRVGSQLAEVVRRHHKVSRREARRRAVELLETVRIPEPAAVARRYPQELSGGMAQRVSIALALAGEPALLIADEPTTALDVTVQAEILALLRDLRSRLDMAIVFVTHDWGVLADICDRAVVMYAGEVVEEATVTDLYRSPRHPYTQRLLAANPHLAPVSDLLPTIPGSVPSPSTWETGCRFRPRCAYAEDACAAGPIPLLPVGAGRAARCIRHEEVAGR